MRLKEFFSSGQVQLGFAPPDCLLKYGSQQHQQSFNDLFINRMALSKTDVIPGISTVLTCTYDYIYNRSGMKTCSELLIALTDDSMYPQGFFAKLSLLCDTIYDRFYVKWNKLYDTMILEYDALKPFSMSISDSSTSNGSSRTDQTVSSNETESYNDHGETSTDVYGFNSSTAVPKDEGESSQSGSSNGTRTTTNGTSATRQEGVTRTITRSGNIGNITSQKLIEEQRNLLNWQILDVIFKDLDSVLTRSVYED